METISLQTMNEKLLQSPTYRWVPEIVRAMVEEGLYQGTGQFIFFELIDLKQWFWPKKGMAEAMMEIAKFMIGEDNISKDHFLKMALIFVFRNSEIEYANRS